MRETVQYAWDVLKSPLRFKEITAPTASQISADTLALYAKDRSGVSGLYYKDDAGVEHDLGALTSAQALTRVNDTNVTLTLGGSPTTALLAATSLTLGWSGTLAAARGGTGVATLGDVTAASSKITLAGTPTGAAITSFSIDVNQANLDHGSIGGLSDDDHSIYALLAGRNGGQTLIGGTASLNNLNLQGSSHADGGYLTLNDDAVAIGSADTAAVQSSPTISSSSARVGGMRITPTFSGSGDDPQGFFAAPNFAPSGNLTTAAGFLGLAVASPASGKTITTLRSLYAANFFSDVAGVVTNSHTIVAGTPSISGALKPATSIGVNIQQQGAAGITTAIGLFIAAQANATSNFDMGFDRVDTTAAGAYYGRIPVYYNGGLKYIHVFSA